MNASKLIMLMHEHFKHGDGMKSCQPESGAGKSAEFFFQWVENVET